MSDDALCASRFLFLGTEQLSPLLITATIQRLVTARHYAYICSSGSNGYHAFKEMLQNGVRGSILLLENYDLRSDRSSTATTQQTPDTTTSTMPSPTETTSILLSTTTTPENSKDSLFSRIKVCPYSGLGIYDLPTPVTLLSNLSTLPHNLFWGCIGLRTLDLTQLSPLNTKLPEDFLSRCTELEILHLPDHHSQLPLYFLSGCTGLKSLDLRSMSQLKDIPLYFLSGCSGLETLHLPPHQSKIPQYFLSRCASLKSLDLRPLSNLKGALPLGFLSDCSGLTELDLTPLIHITALPDAFLSGCTGLRTITLCPHHHPLLNTRLLPPDCVVNIAAN